MGNTGDDQKQKPGEANGQTSNTSTGQKSNKPIGWKYSLFVSEIPPGENSEKVNNGKSNKPPGSKYSLFVLEKDPTPSQFKPNKSWKMPVQRSGALETTFAVSRGVQIISLIAIIGMSANFIAEMVNTNQSPPHVLIGTLTVTCVAVLYCVITTILFFDSKSHDFPFFSFSGLDFAVLIALIVVAVLVGQPLSYLNCAALQSSGGVTAAFIDSVGTNVSKSNYWVWAGVTSTACYEMKSIWGLSIALCILFFTSGVALICVWSRERKNKKAVAAGKGDEEK